MIFYLMVSHFSFEDTNKIFYGLYSPSGEVCGGTVSPICHGYLSGGLSGSYSYVSLPVVFSIMRS